MLTKPDVGPHLAMGGASECKTLGSLATSASVEVNLLVLALINGS